LENPAFSIPQADLHFGLRWRAIFTALKAGLPHLDRFVDGEIDAGVSNGGPTVEEVAEEHWESLIRTGLYPAQYKTCLNAVLTH
jgi:hypothetical protein